jgi:hypothetical protein
MHLLEAGSDVNPSWQSQPAFKRNKRARVSMSVGFTSLNCLQMLEPVELAKRPEGQSLREQPGKNQKHNNNACSLSYLQAPVPVPARPTVQS